MVTEHYATGWKRELACENTVGYATDLQRSRELRDALVNDAGDWANGLDLSAENMHRVFLSFLSKTSKGFDQNSFRAIAFLTVLSHPLPLASIVKQCFAN